MSESRISNSYELNNTGHTTGKNNCNVTFNNGSPEFKMGCGPKEGFPAKTLYDRKSDIKNFIENNQVLKLTKKYNLSGDEKEPKTGTKPDIEVEISNKEEPLGKGSFGDVYDAEVTQPGNVDQDKKENNIKYAVKVPKDSNNTNAFADLEKSELLIKEMVNFTKKTGVCATLQTLELMVPVLGKVNVGLSNYDLYDSEAMLMMKVDGKDGSNAILGNKSKSVKPIEGYDTEISVGNEKYYCVADPKISLDIAFQKIFALRGLHDVGLVYGDVKIENVMIQKENDKYTVRLIDIGSIIKKGSANFACTPSTAAPEVFVGGKFREKYKINPKFDVFANAVDMPYILFGNIAKKYLARGFKDKDMPKIFSKMKSSFERISPRFEKWGRLKTLFMFIFSSKEYEEHKKNETFDYVFNGRYTRYKNKFYISDIFSAYEYADSDDIEEMLKEYDQDEFEKPDFSSANFPKDMTSAQKMRYMHWHLGFLKTNGDIESGTVKNGEKGKGVYPTEVIHSLALLQMYSTDPDPKKRISSRVVERVLLHLKMTVDQWENRQYRIEGMEDDDLNENEREAVDIILPKNEANKKNKS